MKWGAVGRGRPEIAFGDGGDCSAVGDWGDRLDASGSAERGGFGGAHPAGRGCRIWLVPVYMVGFAAINALIEEIIWRGVEMAALEAAFGVGVLALVLQAVQFGLAHYRGGFPNGWSGVGLTFLFGLAMGWLRMRTKGLLVPWVAHAAADFTIIWLVVHRVELDETSETADPPKWFISHIPLLFLIRFRI